MVEGAALRAGAVVAAVIGVVFFTTGGVGALIEAAAEFASTAREDAPDGLVVGAG